MEKKSDMSYPLDTEGFKNKLFKLYSPSHSINEFIGIFFNENGSVFLVYAFR